MLKEVENTDMVVSMDYGERSNVHPVKKHIVGERLALLAEDKMYNIINDGACPIYDKLILEDNKIVISFDYYEKQELVLKDGRELSGFEISEDGKKYFSIKAEIKENKVVIDVSHIKNPLYVRYAWKDYCKVNLFNKRGFAASPFMEKIR